MLKHRFSLLFVLISLFSLSIASAQDVHFTYEGEDGPENWGTLSTDWASCGEGQAQSPINISGAIGVDLSDIEMNYQESAMNIFNNGHTIQVNYDEGSSITYNEIDYQLLQFHFHHPSEHILDGASAPMEIHFVHRSASGSLAVVGVMLMEGDEANAAYAPIFEHLPAEESEADAMGMTINAADLIPAGSSFYTYNGSLTTPPCTEIVRWLVLAEPVTLSAEQIEAFGAIFENNARPTQELNTRDLFMDTSS